MITTGSVMLTHCDLSEANVYDKSLVAALRSLRVLTNSKLHSPSKRIVMDNYMMHMPNVYIFILQSPLSLSTSSQICVRFDAWRVLGTPRGNC